MERALTAATAMLTALPLVAAAPAYADHLTAPVEPRVVVEGLDNPRQLSWDAGGTTLVVAEAGSGGDDCTIPDAGPEGPAEQCTGPSGAVSIIPDPWSTLSTISRVITGLPSTAGPDGSFALGHTGADAVEGLHPRSFLSVRNPLGDPATETGQGVYSLTNTTGAPDGRSAPPGSVLPGGDVSLPLVELFAHEQSTNPGGQQVESNPYAIVFHDPTPKVAHNDGFAYVADAGANAVWKVEPDRDADVPAPCESDAPPPEDFDPGSCLAIDTTVFASWDDRSTPEAMEVEFVPTSVAVDDSGHLFVGGLGSDLPGAASVVELDLTGEVVRTWTGFTGITGVAVDDDNLYVSQLFGSGVAEPTGAPGDVVRTSRSSTDAARQAVDVPFPAGLAVDRAGNVYVAVNSIAPSTGVGDAGAPEIGPGAVWDIDFTGARTIEPTPVLPPDEGPPPDADGEFVPLPDEEYPTHVAQACGTTVTVSPGDVREVERRITHDDDGTTTSEYRGRTTVDVLRESDGAVLDELDAGGPGSEVSSEPTEDGRLTITFSFEGPTLVLPFDEVEADVIAAAGLPPFFYYTGGTFTETVELQLSDSPDGTPATVSAVIQESTVTGVRDVCDMLDAAEAAEAFPLQRLAGADRHATAARIAMDTFERADTAILARGDVFADALSANYLAGVLGAPILLTSSSSLPAVTAAALASLGVHDVVVIGGTTAVSSDVERRLAEDYAVERIAGADRYLTAERVAGYPAQHGADAVGEVDGLRTAILGSGQDFPDILAAGPLSYAERLPILLSRSGDLPPSTSRVLAALDIEQVVVVGGTSAVSPAVRSAVEAATGRAVLPVFGRTRYETAVAIADFARAELGFDPTVVDLARGDDFADALAGGPHGGVERAAMVLTLPGTMPAATAEMLSQDCSALTHGHVLGGPAAISQDVEEAAERAGSSCGTGRTAAG